MNIGIFGLGYVGTVNGACLAELGHKVIGIDIKPEKVEAINAGKPLLSEPGLNKLIEKHKGTNFIATTDISEAVKNSNIGFICVGTPLDTEDNVDISRVKIVFDAMIEKITGPYIIVIRSTTPPGTIEELRRRLPENSQIQIVSNPEFLREGNAVEDFFKPHLVVVGSDDKEAVEKVAELYRGVEGKIHKTDEKISETIKYVNNSWHALKIAFTNEVASIAANKGIDSNKLMEVFCMEDKLNISTKYHRPGFAYGGSCLPKDTTAFVNMAHRAGLRIPLINAIEDSNSEHIERAIKKILETGKKKIGILGISFKYDGSSGDPRGSPVIRLLSGLLELGYLRLFDKGYETTLFDPYIDVRELESFLPHLVDKLEKSLDTVLETSDVIVIGNAIPEIQDLPEKLEEKHTIIDLQGCLDKKLIKKGTYIRLF